VTIRVVLADDQAMVRVGFRMILEAGGDIEVMGEAEDGEHAVATTRKLRPDVVLMHRHRVAAGTRRRRRNRRPTRPRHQSHLARRPHDDAHSPRLPSQESAVTPTRQYLVVALLALSLLGLLIAAVSHGSSRVADTATTGAAPEIVGQLPRAGCSVPAPTMPATGDIANRLGSQPPNGYHWVFRQQDDTGGFVLVGPNQSCLNQSGRHPRLDR